LCLLEAAAQMCPETRALTFDRGRCLLQQLRLWASPN
jgi:hypothetical protein